MHEVALTLDISKLAPHSRVFLLTLLEIWGEIIDTSY